MAEFWFMARQLGRHDLAVALCRGVTNAEPPEFGAELSVGLRIKSAPSIGPGENARTAHLGTERLDATAKRTV